jgi:hypothetical protein
MFTSDLAELSSTCDSQGLFTLLVTDIVGHERLRLLELSITAEALGLAVTCLGEQPCQAKWRIGSLRPGVGVIEAAAKLFVVRSGKNALLGVEDVPSSTVQALTLTMPIARVMLALGGRGSAQPCSATWGVGLVGKKREHKTEFVPVEEKDVTFARLEVDGWLGRRADMENRHLLRTVGKKEVMGYEVTFERWT